MLPTRYHKFRYHRPLAVAPIALLASAGVGLAQQAPATNASGLLPHQIVTTNPPPLAPYNFNPDPGGRAQPSNIRPPQVDIRMNPGQTVWDWMNDIFPPQIDIETNWLMNTGAPPQLPETFNPYNPGADWPKDVFPPDINTRPYWLTNTGTPPQLLAPFNPDPGASLKTPVVVEPFFTNEVPLPPVHPGDGLPLPQGLTTPRTNVFGRGLELYTIPGKTNYGTALPPSTSNCRAATRWPINTSAARGPTKIIPTAGPIIKSRRILK